MKWSALGSDRKGAEAEFAETEDLARTPAERARGAVRASGWALWKDVVAEGIGRFSVFRTGRRLGTLGRQGGSLFSGVRNQG